MMDAHALGSLVVAGGAALVVVWVLRKVGKAIAAVLEALATLTMLFLAVWLLGKTGCWLVKTIVVH